MIGKKLADRYEIAAELGRGGRPDYLEPRKATVTERHCSSIVSAPCAFTGRADAPPPRPRLHSPQTRNEYPRHGASLDGGERPARNPGGQRSGPDLRELDGHAAQRQSPE